MDDQVFESLGVVMWYRRGPLLLYLVLVQAEVVEMEVFREW